MAYYYQAGVIVPFAKKFYKQLIIMVLGLFVATMAAMTLSTSALAPCSFTTVGSTMTLNGDCETTAQVNVPTGMTVDGNGFTMYPMFTKTDNSNNAALGVLADNVTIKNITIDGVAGTNLHGINVYVAQNVVIRNATVKNNDRSGIAVNGSNVTVRNVTTSGNGWHGINVDQGSGVTTSSVLNITGPMTQTDVAQIYVDDTTKNVAVNDALSQYSYVDPAGSPANDRLYSRKYVTSKKECKNDGWKLGASATKSFKNQGKCVEYFEKLNHNNHGHHDHDDDDDDHHHDDRRH